MIDTILHEISSLTEFIILQYRHTAPYLLLTLPLAVGINISGLSRHIGRAFRSKPLISILLATLIGAFSPFCSCSVIPIITGLLISGVPLAPVMSFWLASPSMDPEIFFLSVSMIGWDLAVWRLASTFLISLGSGYLVLLLGRKGLLTEQVLKNAQPQQTTARQAVLPVPATSCCGTSASCSAGEERSLVNRIIRETVKFGLMILKFMTLAYALEFAIKSYLPVSLITNVLGREGMGSLLTATAIGVPLYTTNLTALGLVKGLLGQGMQPGAALSFLIGGAMTTIPAMSAVYGIVKPKVFLVYLTAALAGALLSGLLFSLAGFIS